MNWKRLFRLLILTASALVLAISNAENPDSTSDNHRQPPGGFIPKNIPQFVCITFDDNFGLAHPQATGGMNYIIDFYKDKRNPPGPGNIRNFDGTPIHATFFYTSIYLVDDSKKVLGGKPGEDHDGRNRAAWTAAFRAGHEA